MLEHAKVVSGHPSWEIRGTQLTVYVKVELSDQDIPPDKSEALNSPSMLEYAKVVWVIRTSLLRNQRHWTHCLCWNMFELSGFRASLLKNQRHWTYCLCWNMQRLCEWSEHPSWKTGLTVYVGACKSCLCDQDIPSRKSKALDSPPMLEHAKIISLKLIRNVIYIYIIRLTYL